MDDRRFDHLTRALGGASTRRGALGALLGLGAGAAISPAGAKKRRKKCDPACASGQTCVKGACVCDDGGTVCGASCCAIGQRCESGRCVVDPAPDACIVLGEACKDTGRPCCASLTCASGQGGTLDVACYRPAGAACQRTEECVYDAVCRDGLCVANDHPDDDSGGDAMNLEVCRSGCRFTTIAEAVAAAAPGATITVRAGTYEACNVEIDKDLTIVGAGAGPAANVVPPTLPSITGPNALDPNSPPSPSGFVPETPANWDPVAENPDGTNIVCLQAGSGSRRRVARSVGPQRVFRVLSGRRASVFDVRLARGNAGTADGGRGGLILNEGELFLTDVDLASGFAARGGGLVANTGTLEVQRCQFLDGEAGTYPNPVPLPNPLPMGGGLLNGGTATLAGTSRPGRPATTFAWNAAFSGGAIANVAVTSAAPSLRIVDAARIEGNWAWGVGGGVAALAGTATIGGCASSEGCGTDAVSIAGNFAYDLTTSPSLSIDGSGGGIAIGSAAFASQTPAATVTVAGRAEIDGNLAGKGGGGVYIAADGGFTLRGSAVVSGNETISPRGDGGGAGIMRYQGGVMTLEDSSTVTGNETFAPGGAIRDFNGVTSSALSALGVTTARVFGNLGVNFLSSSNPCDGCWTSSFVNPSGTCVTIPSS